jgi:hypothetical protein
VLYLAVGACVVAAGVLVFVLLRDTGGDSTATEGTTTPVTGLPCFSASGRCAFITDLTLEGGTYVADYTTEGYDPIIFDEAAGVGTADDHHLHFFFNTTAPENAGANGPDPGTWKIWDRLLDEGRFQFDEFTLSNMADNGGEGATQLCSLVADSSHGVETGTGNCVDLPSG